MGQSQSSKLAPESIIGSNREYAINFITSSTSGIGSKSGFGSKVRKESEVASNRDPDLVNTSFKWNYAAQQVLVSGTFTGWKDHIPLKKIGNEFTTIVRLPRGLYYYKYIVDGEWKFSPDDPTVKDDQGNMNNVIDTTNLESVNAIIGNKSDMRKPGSEVKGLAKDPFAEDVPLLPPHLMGMYFMNEKEKKLQDEKSPSSDSGNEETEKKKPVPKKEPVSNKNELGPPTHVILNHLGTFNAANGEAPYEVATMTQRFKSKYATIIFYSTRFSHL